ncbi:hypothetical protein JCM10212_006182 [Sporobolomyces blumeae]
MQACDPLTAWSDSSALSSFVFALDPVAVIDHLASSSSFGSSGLGGSRLLGRKPVEEDSDWTHLSESTSTPSPPSSSSGGHPTSWRSFVAKMPDPVPHAQAKRDVLAKSRFMRKVSPRSRRYILVNPNFVPLPKAQAPAEAYWTAPPTRTSPNSLGSPWDDFCHFSRRSSASTTSSGWGSTSYVW